MEPKDSKQALRRNVIAKRKATTITERRQAGEALARGIDALPLPRQQRTVAAFLSMGSEIETRPLLHALAEQGYRILLPRLGSGLDIGWGEYSDLPIEDLGMHRPQEPSGDTLPADALAQAGLVLLPALLVDIHGTRLGRGGGWYDRALAIVRQARRWWPYAGPGRWLAPTFPAKDTTFPSPARSRRSATRPSLILKRNQA